MTTHQPALFTTTGLIRRNNAIARIKRLTAAADARPGGCFTTTELRAVRHAQAIVKSYEA